MAGCCWYPIEYDLTEMIENQVSKTAWWNDMGNYYVPGEVFDNTLLAGGSNALSSSFMSGRHKFFPAKDQVFLEGRVDVFGELSDHLGTLLFDTNGQRHTSIAANSFSRIPVFDGIHTTQSGTHGASVDVVFVVAPLEEIVRIPDPAGDGTTFITFRYGWLQQEVVESMAPGRYTENEFGFSDPVPGEIFFEQFPWARALYNTWQLIVATIVDANNKFHSTPSVTVPDPPSRPHFYRDRFFLPGLTTAGGYAQLKTDIYRAHGAQRLTVELRRNIAAHAKPAPKEDDDPETNITNAAPHYAIGVELKGWNANVDPNLTDSSGFVPTHYKSGIVYSATRWGENIETIDKYHERRFPGTLDRDVYLRINDEPVELGDIQSKLVFQNVQEYSPPTDFMFGLHQGTEQDTFTIPNLEASTEPEPEEVPAAPTLPGNLGMVKAEIIKPVSIYEPTMDCLPPALVYGYDYACFDQTNTFNVEEFSYSVSYKGEERKIWYVPEPTFDHTIIPQPPGGTQMVVTKRTSFQEHSSVWGHLEGWFAPEIHSDDDALGKLDDVHTAWEVLATEVIGGEEYPQFDDPSHFLVIQIRGDYYLCVKYARYCYWLTKTDDHGPFEKCTTALVPIARLTKQGATLHNSQEAEWWAWRTYRSIAIVGGSTRQRAYAPLFSDGAGLPNPYPEYT